MALLTQQAPSGRGGPPAPAPRRRAVLRLLPLAPAVALLAVFLAGPIAYSLYGSLTNAALTGYRAARPQFVGLDNYVQLLGSGAFWNSVWLTLLFVGLSAVVGQNVLGMALALMMRVSARPLRTVVGAVVVTAWVLPEIVAAFACYALFSTDGTLNAVLGWFGLDGPTWLVTFPMLSVIVANVWRGTAFSMLLLYAGLQSVQRELYEAAEVDGASRRRQFWHVTLPQLRGVLLVNVVLITIATLNTFDMILPLTGGGPAQATEVLALHTFSRVFVNFDLAGGSVLALLLLVISLVLTVVYRRLLRT